MSNKVLIFSDVHWGAKSSVLNKQGMRYTARLEQLIKGMNWVNQVAIDKDCKFMICAGDMMDQSACTDEEITSIKDIKWNNLNCYFLCGNHESSKSDLSISTVKILEDTNHFIITEAGACTDSVLANLNTQIQFIPYVTESDRKELGEYLKNADKSKKQVVISHNEIAGIQYGGFTSKLGFSIEEIEANADLYLNGHLHNSEFITDKILNVGSFSAHNFTNDSAVYKYGIWILDLDTLELEFIENPYAYNFYKLEINSPDDLMQLAVIKPNSAITIKYNESYDKDVRAIVERNPNIIYHRYIIRKNLVSDAEIEANISELTVDYITKFNELALAKLENTQILLDELALISA